jgi:hypothetical protein
MSPTNKKHHGKAKNATTTPSRTPNAAPPLDALPPAPTTRTAFREFIELADLKSIKHFLDTAASSPEGENLRLLWARAFKEGLTIGHQLYGKTEEKLNEAHNSGYEAGYDEGRREEQGDWLIEGHGEHCGFQPTVVCEDSAVQTENDLPPRLTSTVATQVDTPPPLVAMATVQIDTSKSTPPRSVTTTAVQVDAPKIRPTTQPAPCTVNISVQTSTLGTQYASSQTSPRPSPIPDPIHITSAPPPSLNWADDASSLPISTLPTSSPPIPLPPNLPSSPPPRDLSILRSSTTKPFSSLQHRNNRSRAHFSQPLRNQQSFIPYQAFPRRRFPPPWVSFTPSRSARVYPHRRPCLSSTSALNWEADPRLFELSQALSALGWVRP